MDASKILKIKKALSTPLYDDLVEWLTLQVRDMRDIENVRECSKAQDQALEFKAQLKAKRRLEAVLQTIVDIKAMAEPEQDGENDYGVDQESDED